MDPLLSYDDPSLIYDENCLYYDGEFDLACLGGNNETYDDSRYTYDEHCLRYDDGMDQVCLGNADNTYDDPRITYDERCFYYDGDFDPICLSGSFPPEPVSTRRMFSGMPAASPGPGVIFKSNKQFEIDKKEDAEYEYKFETVLTNINDNIINLMFRKTYKVSKNRITFKATGPLIKNKNISIKTESISINANCNKNINGLIRYQKIGKININSKLFKN